MIPVSPLPKTHVQTRIVFDPVLTALITTQEKRQVNNGREYFDFGWSLENFSPFPIGGRQKQRLRMKGTFAVRLGLAFTLWKEFEKVSISDDKHVYTLYTRTHI